MDKKIDYSKIYSPSRLSMFDICPKQYHFYYVDPVYTKMKKELKKYPENIFPFQTLGKAVHDAITLFYHSPVARRAKDELKKHLENSWQSEVMRSKKPPLGKWGGFETLNGEREAYRQALLMLYNFLKIADTTPEIEYLPTDDFRNSIEDYGNLVVPLSSDFDISGKFDLILKEDDSLHVVDFKTGKSMKDEPFQLKFYKVLAEENFKKPVKKASFYFLRTGSKKEFNLAAQDTERIKEEILAKIKKVYQTENFETKPGRLCQYCLFKNFCPEKEKVKEFIGKSEEESYSSDLPF